MHSLAQFKAFADKIWDLQRISAQTPHESKKHARVDTHRHQACADACPMDNIPPPPPHTHTLESTHVNTHRHQGCTDACPPDTAKQGFSPK
eukprot:1084234-Pelagomonas_calceolata.AAC.1